MRGGPPLYPPAVCTDRPWVVVGGGGHGRVVADLLLAAGAEVRGVVDPAFRVGEVNDLGLPVLGGDDALGRDGLNADSIFLSNGIGSLPGRSGARRAVFTRLCAAGYRFPAVVHRQASVAAGVTLEDGVQVMAGAVVQAGTRVRFGSIVNTRACVDHDCDIGAHGHVAPGAVVCGDVTVGEGVHLGAGCVIIQGLAIGAAAVVNAGVTVCRPVAAGVTVRLSERKALP